MHLSAKRAPRALLVTLLAIPAATVVAACGSSSSSSSSSSASASSGATGTGGSAQLSKYQSCLKSHGVTISLHRPAGATGGFGPTGASGHFTPPSGATGHFTPPKGGFKPGSAPGGGAGFLGAGGHGASKKDEAAFKACASDAPKGGFGGGFRGGPGASGGATGGAGAQFSAATLKKFAACVKQHGYTLPKANTSGSGPIYPKSIESNKKFQTASKSCTSLLRAGGTGSAGSSGSGT